MERTEGLMHILRKEWARRNKELEDIKEGV
jgi:hypothetical protein